MMQTTKILGSMCVAGAMTFALLGGPASADDHQDHAAMSPAIEASLQKLMEGNQRFVNGESSHPNMSKEYREELSKGQSPYAVIVSCADSRVPPELLFDAGPGDLFVIRDAGNVVGDNEMASVEYAVAVLGTPVVVVVGHESCGAVDAAVKTRTEGAEFEGKIDELVATIMPSVKSAQERAEGGELLEAAIEDNAQRVAEQLRTSDPFLSQAIADGKLKVIAARYDLNTGQVTAYAMKASTCAMCAAGETCAKCEAKKKKAAAGHSHSHDGEAAHSHDGDHAHGHDGQHGDKAKAVKTEGDEIISNPSRHRDQAIDQGTGTAATQPAQETGDATDAAEEEVIDNPSRHRD